MGKGTVWRNDVPPICNLCRSFHDVVRRGDAWICERHDPVYVVGSEDEAGFVWIAQGSMAKRFHRTADCGALDRGLDWTEIYGGAQARPLERVGRGKALAKGRTACRSCY